MTGDIGIHTGDIGIQPATGLIVELFIGPFGMAVDTDGSDEAVDRQRRLAGEFRQPPRSDPALKLHLPEPVLGVEETEGKDRVLDAPGLDMGYVVLVTDDRDLA